MAFAREALPDRFGPFLPGDPEPPPSGHKLLCHCSAGYNRGPSTCYFLLRALGWSPWQAKAAIWWHRPITLLGGMQYRADAEAALKDLGLSDQTSPDVWD